MLMRLKTRGDGLMNHEPMLNRFSLADKDLHATGFLKRTTARSRGLQAKATQIMTRDSHDSPGSTAQRCMARKYSNIRNCHAVSVADMFWVMTGCRFSGCNDAPPALACALQQASGLHSLWGNCSCFVMLHLANRVE